MKMSETITIETENRVTTLTISRPEKRNALTQAMYSVLANALSEYGENDDARAFVITGTEGVFTSGNDLSDFANRSDSNELPPVVQFLLALKDCPKPVIAAVNGRAIGVGLTMLLHCDLVYAAESAALSAPFVKLGLVPEAGSSMLLPAAMGMAVANDVMLAGRVLTANEAHQYGLVARVFPDADLMQEVQQIAAQVANSAPSALKRSKSVIRFQRDQVAEQMAKEGKLFVEQLASPDFAESVAAMMEKRQPVYG